MKKKIKKEKPDISYRIEKTAAFWMFIHPNIYVIEDYLEYINLLKPFYIQIDYLKFSML